MWAVPCTDCGHRGGGRGRRETANPAFFARHSVATGARLCPPRRGGLFLVCLAVALHGLSPHPGCPPSELSVILHPAPSSCPLSPGPGAAGAAQPLQGARVCPSSCWPQAAHTDLPTGPGGGGVKEGGEEGRDPMPWLFSCLRSFSSIPPFPAASKEGLSLWQGWKSSRSVCCDLNKTQTPSLAPSRRPLHLPTLLQPWAPLGPQRPDPLPPWPHLPPLCQVPSSRPGGLSSGAWQLLPQPHDSAPSHQGKGPPREGHRGSTKNGLRSKKRQTRAWCCLQRAFPGVPSPGLRDGEAAGRLSETFDRPPDQPCLTPCSSPCLFFCWLM